MKKIALITLAGLMLTAAVPTFAQQTNEEKVICQLSSKNCLSTVEAIQHKMKKVSTEIKKGTKVYSAEDLKKIEDKLKEAKDMLDKLEGKAPGK